MSSEQRNYLNIRNSNNEPGKWDDRSWLTKVFFFCQKWNTSLISSFFWACTDISFFYYLQNYSAPILWILYGGYIYSAKITLKKYAFHQWCSDSSKSLRHLVCVRVVSYFYLLTIITWRFESWLANIRLIKMTELTDYQGFISSILILAFFLLFIY